jgi:hypothetical protein
VLDWRKDRASCEYLDVGLRGLLITAFAAAFMSTIKTQLNWGASYLVRDGYCRFVRPHASDLETFFARRVVTVTLSVLVIVLTALT